MAKVQSRVQSATLNWQSVTVSLLWWCFTTNWIRPSPHSTEVEWPVKQGFPPVLGQWLQLALERAGSLLYLPCANPRLILMPIPGSTQRHHHWHHSFDRGNWDSGIKRCLPVIQGASGSPGIHHLWSPSSVFILGSSLSLSTFEQQGRGKEKKQAISMPWLKDLN